jgi:acetyl esterase/lipase
VSVTGRTAFFGVVLVGMAVLAGCSRGPFPGVGPVPTLSAGQSATVTFCNDQQARITEPAVLHGDASTAVYVHGGDWVSGNLDTGGFAIHQIGPALNAKGFVVMSVDYRLGPENLWPDQIEDVKCAVRYLRANARALNVDPDRIGIWGQSAGGQLAALVATAGPTAGWDVGVYRGQSSKVAAVVDLSGPSDLVSMSNSGASGFVKNTFVKLLGPLAPAALLGTLTDAGPVHYVAPGDPPFLIFDGDADAIVFASQSEELTQALKSAGDSAQLVIVHGGGHALSQTGENPDQDQIATMVVNFFSFVLALQPHG